MKRLVLVFLSVLIPVAAFAQTPQQHEQSFLKSRFGLNDSQISQVIDLQNKTATQVREASAHIRVLRAQLAEALIPTSPDMGAVNNLITQIASSRADLQKVIVAASISLRQIVGDQTYYEMVSVMHGKIERMFGSAFAMSGMMPGMMPGGAAAMPQYPNAGPRRFYRLDNRGVSNGQPQVPFPGMTGQAQQ